MKKFLREFYHEIMQVNIGAYACQTAFFTILSFIPFMMLFISLIQYTPISENVILSVIGKVMPAYIAPLIVSIISEIYSNSIGIVSISAVTAMWSAAKGLQYLSNGLNAIYHCHETRNWLVLRFRAMFYTVLMVIAFILCFVLLMFGKQIQRRITNESPTIAKFMYGMIDLRLWILLLGLIFLFILLFRALPNKKISYLGLLPGSIIAAIGWYALSFGISIYVSYFHGFTMYGSLATIVLMMLWIYFCAYILLICAELNYLIGERFAHRVRKKRQK